MHQVLAIIMENVVKILLLENCKLLLLKITLTFNGPYEVRTRAILGNIICLLVNQVPET